MGKFIAYSGGCRNLENTEDIFSLPLLKSWCPKCLLEDIAEGRDQYFRKQWGLSFVTHCQTHQTPLTATCLNCHNTEATQVFVQVGERQHLFCEYCSQTLAGRQGIECMCAEHNLALLNQKGPKYSWAAATGFEGSLLEQMGLGQEKGNIWLKTVLSLCNLFLTSDRMNPSIIEFFETAVFPARKVPMNIRRLDLPFAAADLTQRRKSLALAYSILTSTSEVFTAGIKHRSTMSSEPTLSALRTVMLQSNQISWMNCC